MTTTKTFPPRMRLFNYANDDEPINYCQICGTQRDKGIDQEDSLCYISLEEHLHLMREAKADAYEEAAKTFEAAGELAISLAYKDKAAELRKEIE